MLLQETLKTHVNKFWEFASFWEDLRCLITLEIGEWKTANGYHILTSVIIEIVELDSGWFAVLLPYVCWVMRLFFPFNFKRFKWNFYRFLLTTLSLRTVLKLCFAAPGCLLLCCLFRGRWSLDWLCTGKLNIFRLRWFCCFQTMRNGCNNTCLAPLWPCPLISQTTAFLNYSSFFPGG